MKNLVLVLALSITGMVAAQNTEKKENATPKKDLEKFIKSILFIN